MSDRTPEPKDMDEAEQNRLMALYDEVADENGIRRAIWSIYEIDDFSVEHPFPGAVTLRYNYAYDGTQRIERPIEGRTWLDLWKAADEIIVAIQPDDHVFVEVFHKAAPGILELQTGS